jgi:inosose dehydratase
MDRRELLTLLMGGAALPLATACSGTAVSAETRTRYRVGYSGFAFQNEVERGIATLGEYGLHGIEPFRQHIMPYVERPEAFGELLDAAGIALVTASNGGPGMSTNFIDPARVGQTIEDHVVFARDFIRPLGSTVFKINVGSRPEEGPLDAQLVTMSEALNELGRRTADMGIKLAPHPHIWGPLERPEEIARVTELTDPEYVGFTVDTAHYRLGGSDPIAYVRDHFDRVAHLHFKDAPLKFRDHTGPTPTREEHRENNLYPPMGAGGVDFVGLVRLLNERRYDGWITLDYDPPRPIEGTIDQQLTHNRFYTTEFLRIEI